jgi:hypothetical protein
MLVEQLQSALTSRLVCDIDPLRRKRQEIIRASPAAQRRELTRPHLVFSELGMDPSHCND